MKKKSTPDAKYLKFPNLAQFYMDIVNNTRSKESDFTSSDGPIISLSGTDFRYCPSGEIYQDLISGPEFCRLQFIKQLGTVGTMVILSCQNQTRGLHSYIAGIMMDIVIYRNKLSEHERKLGIAAGLYHDLAICPYSEQGKLIDPKSLEEEDLIEGIIKKAPKINSLLEKHDISIDKLVNTIKGKGKIGKLINSKEGLDVDNLSYLAVDQSLFYCPLSSIDKKISCDDPFFDIIEFKKEKGLFDQYKNIDLIDGNWVFNNPKLLVKLLKFRALMYSKVYNNPINRAKEAFLGRLIKEKNIKLDKNEILRWIDGDFEHWFLKEFGKKIYSNFFYTTMSLFRQIGKEKDITKLEQLRKEKEKGNVIVERLKPPRDAIKNLVLYKNKVILLEKIPEFQKEIDEIRSIIKEIDCIGIYEKAEGDEEFTMEELDFK